jgi:hypothetical protein
VPVSNSCDPYQDVRRVETRRRWRRRLKARGDVRRKRGVSTSFSPADCRSPISIDLQQYCGRAGGDHKECQERERRKREERKWVGGRECEIDREPVLQFSFLFSRQSARPEYQMVRRSPAPLSLFLLLFFLCTDVRGRKTSLGCSGDVGGVVVDSQDSGLEMAMGTRSSIPRGEFLY